MEYVYAALLIHKAGKQVTEQTVKKVLEAAGAKVDEARVKALVSALEGVNIDESIKEAAVQVVAPVQSAQAAPAEQKKEAPKEDKKSEEQAAVGLASLFG